MRIFIALSGGVDSSAAALLLKEQGYDVRAGIMVFKGISDDIINRARTVAERLAIPFHVFDLSKEFKEMVLAYFIDEYEKGRTPNPCVKCNELIKFGIFAERAFKLGADRIATGHYAGVQRADNRFLLTRGIDKNEQSYFLYRLGQAQLSKIIFPLGNYTKDMAREKARSAGLLSADQKKSQDICFVSGKNYLSFLKSKIQPKPGAIHDKAGKKIGEHEGIIAFTIGQRRGIGLSRGSPYYVTRIDPVKNIIYVGEKQDVYQTEFVAGQLRFIPFDTLESKITVKAKTRYVSPLQEATIEPYKKNKVKVVFKRAQWAVTPGQSVVFYSQDTVLGGGIIEPR
jgi:tRNA-specific 2-thiouridylase